jgi:hypothetical protein
VSDYVPVPVEAARQIARTYAKQIVVVLSIDKVFSTTHITTYGVAAEDKIVAANIGEELAKEYGGNPRTTFEDFKARTQAEAAETIERLTAELAHVRGERDRLFVTAYLEHQMETDPIGDRIDRTYDESISQVLEWMARDDLVLPPECVTLIRIALAEHDRRHREAVTT